MNSKEALERILMLARPCAYEVREHRNNYCDMLENAIKQDLEQLKELRKNHAKLLVQVAHLEEENEKLEKENEELKEAIKILKDKIEFEDLGEMQGGNTYRGYFNDCLNEEEVSSLRRVFGNG